MTRVVLDASIVLASLIADGPTRDLVLGHYELEFYTPDVVAEELEPHLKMVAERTSKPREIVASLFSDLLLRVEVVPVTAYAAFLPAARKRAEAAHAKGDEAYLALAEAIQAPGWTYDKDFRRVKGLRVLSTADVRLLADASAERSP